MKEKKKELYTDKEIGDFMIEQTMVAYNRGGIDTLNNLFTTLKVMEARNPEIKFSACLNVIEDWKEKLEEAE